MISKLEAPSIIPRDSAHIFAGGRKSEAIELARSLALILYVNHGSRHAQQLTTANDSVIHRDVLPQLAIARTSKHKDKLVSIGLTPQSHVEIFSEAFLGNLKSVKRIAKAASRRLNNKNYVASKSNEDVDVRNARHKRIVENLLKETPTAKELGVQQRIVMVTGPMASGKSETYKNSLQSKEFVMVDLDEIRKYLMINYDPSNQNDIQRVREESWQVSDLLVMEALKQGKSVLMQTPFHRRSRWLKDKNIIYARDNHIPVEIYMILRPMHDCISRNIDRDKRSTSMKDLLASMNGMAVLMKFVKKFANVSKVTLIDFWPLLERVQHLSPKLHKAQYQKLRKYAELRSDIFVVEEQDSELEILPE